jgi:hypothetical protein
VAVLAVVLSLGVSACGAQAPVDLTDSCSIFDAERSWYRATARSQKRWGIPVHVQLAFIYQESRFQARARPERKRFLWVLPGRRPSSAYGYTQAIKTTWKEYQESVGRRGADRDDFDDAVDFIGWYAARSVKRNGIAPGNAYSLYLAYHEGDGGYSRRSYVGKQWLVDVARKVQRRADQYRRQLPACEERFKPRWWTLWTF